MSSPADGNQFDRNWYDYDIVTEAVLAVLAAKPSSPVGLLTDGTVPLTAFIPNDRAFQVLAYDLTEEVAHHRGEDVQRPRGRRRRRRHRAGAALPRRPGRHHHQEAAVNANGAVLTTAQGGTIRVRVYSKYLPIVELRDQDTNDVNPFLNPLALDINKGNRQIAHGIVFVLRPLDL